MPPIESNAASSMTQGPSTADQRMLDAREFRNAMGQFATGVVVITTELDGQAHAMTANAFMSGSLEPALVLVSVARTARMHDRIERNEVFGISVLAESQQACSNHFAGKPSASYEPRFERMAGVPVIEGAAVRLVAQLRHAYECGDHTLFVGEVQELARAPQAPSPLLFHAGRYAALRHPKPQLWGSVPDDFWGHAELSW